MPGTLHDTEQMLNAFSFPFHVLRLAGHLASIHSTGI